MYKNLHLISFIIIFTKKHKMDSFFHLFKTLKYFKGSYVQFIIQKSSITIHSDTSIINAEELQNNIFQIKSIFQKNVYFEFIAPGFKSKGTILLFDDNEQFYKNSNYGLTLICTFKKIYIDHLIFVCKYYNLDITKKLELNKLCDISIKEESNQKYKPKQLPKINRNFKISTNNIIFKINIIGQLNNQFILCKYDQILIIFDQHAIHERIRLEAFLKVSKENLEVLKLKACRGAIKFGQCLGYEIICKLINQLQKCQWPYICAHGRPSVLFLEIKK